MKKFLSVVTLGLFLFSSNAFAEDNKGLNVVLTANDAQTQMMAMVLSMMTIKQKKAVNITLCSSAGDLAVKGKESPLLKPKNKSPKMLLQGLIKSGAKVEVCPLYLPNANLDKSVLLDGITVANPQNVAKQLLNSDFTTLSY
ncbi:hypothetical protein ACMC56_14220 [Campylobacterota bacterium DY0563]|uniref:hypothetical protein n=1 Tax=Halarcobacter sp. TaxID=2321133 RepID=UPI002AA9281E|nr:hypothetical protein [Halarcobacter sp.]